jgi:predicted type IV restriction endonuclease
MCSVPSRVLELIETFDRNAKALHSQQDNETRIRREFIDTFFEELGWDVTNKAGNAHGGWPMK